LQVRTETAVGLFVAIALAIFFYMTFNIGVFRLDWRDYNPHVVYFSQVSGLQVKADVKIAGVKVGWVDSIELLQGDEVRAKARVMINKKYQLYRDAYAVVRQEGMLGSKYLEVIPGDPMLPALGSGEAFCRAGKPPVNVDELFQKFKTIADNVEDITGSLKDAVGGSERDQLRGMVSNFSTAAAHLSSFADRLDATMGRNEENLSSILADFRGFAGDLRTGWPSVQQGIEKISTAVDRDFDRVASRFDSTAQSIEDVANQAKDSMRSIGDVADKINEGRGLLGKLVTEDDTYQDIKVAVAGVKNYFAKVEKLGIVFDAHSEMMWNTAENFRDHLDHHIDKRDAKGYFGLRIHPSEDRFYVAQAVASRKGRVERFTEFFRISEQTGQIPHLDDGMVQVPSLNTDFVTTPSFRILDPRYRETTIQRRGQLTFSIQMAKTFRDLAFRFGLFENTAGMAIDYDMRFRNGQFRWVTSFEMFDFFGDNRIADARPHLKWINRIFIFNNMYMTFGADDFISRHNANAFGGFGLRFADDDVKYLVSRFGGLSG